MEHIIKILTIIGSLLGTIAFFQNFIKDIFSVNKEKWKKVTEIISPLDLDNLQYQILARRIRGRLLNKLENLTYEIEKNNLDVIGFKSVFRNKIHLKLVHFKKLYDDLREYVQVPYWNPFEDKSDGVETFGYEFDKKAFFEDADRTWTQIEYNDATREYADHLHKAGLIAIEMETVFLDIQKLANKEPFELVLPWKWF